jgi:hypothetical protein
MNIKYNYDNDNQNNNNNDIEIYGEKFYEMKKISQNFLKKNEKKFNLYFNSCNNLNNLNIDNNHLIKKSLFVSNDIEEKDIKKEEIASFGLKRFNSNIDVIKKIYIENYNNNSNFTNTNNNQINNNDIENYQKNPRNDNIDIDKSIDMEIHLEKINCNENQNNLYSKKNSNNIMNNHNENNNDNNNINNNINNKNLILDKSFIQKNDRNDFNNESYTNEKEKNYYSTTVENSNSLNLSKISKSQEKSIINEKLNLIHIPIQNSNSFLNSSKKLKMDNIYNNNVVIVNSCLENLNSSTEEDFSQQILDQITQIKYMLEIITKLITYKNVYNIDEKDTKEGLELKGKEKDQIIQIENENNSGNLNQILVQSDINIDIDENYSDDKLFLDPFYFKKGFLFQNYINNGIILDTNNFPKKGYTVLFAFKWEPLSNKAIDKKCDLFYFYENKINEKSTKNLNTIYLNEKDEIFSNTNTDKLKKNKELVKLGMLIENKKLYLISEKDTYNTNIEILPGLSYLVMIKQKEYNSLIKKSSQVNIINYENKNK